MLAGGSMPCATDASQNNYNSRDWLAAMYANGAHGYFDALTHHPLTSGSKHSIRLECYDDVLQASAKVLWKGSGISQRAISKSYLSVN